ncbi:RNA polymerase sigma factor [Tenacibaculum sp. M341]|uniref:RNA polymerase sigma factor n=1 Tax=Tenacibaculum sp. M341 TaxID=2530339 RepID=UPI00105008F1|nr:RNA polymerase sigma factor [Tenacibaculum sp. M341]TCI93724.1 RNA polymerase sigma factor [Tenacibaculum sp. M341]
MKQITDEEIMLAVANGALKKLSILFDRHHVRIYNFFYKMTQNKMVSEDLTQEVFMKVLKYRTSYKEGNFTSWIYTIARNIFSNYYQKQKKERVNLIEDDITSSEEVLFTSNNKDELEHLQKSLLKLNDKDRELIVMNKLQEIKYEQIAEILDSSANAVKVKTHRALKKLKEIYFQSVKTVSNEN